MRLIPPAYLACLACLGSIAPTSALATEAVARIGTTATVETFAFGLDHPWGLAFLPDGRALVTERPGRLRIVAGDGHLSAPLSGVPAVAIGGQGGLLDVAIDPAFASNHFVYLSYVEERGEGTDIAVARARLTDTGLEGTAPIYREDRPANGTANFGSRLAFAPDGTLFVTLGDRFSLRDEAQDLGSPLGKVIRINPDGSIPKGNPFVGKAGARPEIWSYGHRNPEGMAINPVTHTVWTVEHGAKGGDEINHPEAGKNYGWPVITYGTDYDGSKIGIGTVARGMEQPVYYWDPSIAPSGMMFYTGDAFPSWEGSLFVGALKYEMLVRLTLKGEAVMGEERFLTDLHERIRDVRQGPDGLIYLLTDNARGRILRLVPQR